MTTPTPDTSPATPAEVTPPPFTINPDGSATLPDDRVGWIRMRGGGGEFDVRSDRLPYAGAEPIRGYPVHYGPLARDPKQIVSKGGEAAAPAAGSKSTSKPAAGDGDAATPKGAAR